MNANCVICSDLFSQTDEIVGTRCGHVFHHACLLQWIERSQSCPQCRKKTTEKSLDRIYFNFMNTDGIILDAGALQVKLDTVEFQMKEKDKEFTKCQEDKEQLSEICKATEDRLCTLEKSNKEKNGVIEILKERIEYMKTESKELPRLRNEVKALKERLDHLQCLQDIIDSTPATVESVIQKITDPQALNTYIVVLKKAMIQTESKKKSLQKSLKTSQNELQRLKNQNSEQSSELKTLESTINYLEEKNKNIERELIQLKTSPTTLVNETMENAQTDSSAQILASKRKSDIEFDDDIKIKKPCVVNDLTTIECDENPSSSQTSKLAETSSPYLFLKQSSNISNIKTTNTIKQPDLYILKNKKLFERMDSSSGTSIFKGMVQKRKELETSYNGFGGHSKLDVFPSKSTSTVKKNFTSVADKMPKKNKGLKKPENQNTMDNYCT
ncbi:uncharacterized protein LOC143915420 [Arctopsyche grandis]|uniref:uncharacterized protein LOC143915420 n=1 Tax=Arctopsyche grandis TaxID=121162 RepID=UPI00406D834B